MIGDRLGAICNAMRAMLPDGVEFAGGGLEEVDGALFPEEEACLAASGTKRRADFRAGRYYARQALSRLGVASQALPKGPDRAPLWPSGVVGSISHCPDFCGAVVAPRVRFGALGFDVEASGAIPQRLVMRICSEEELWSAQLAGGLAAGHAAKYLFCMKESVYKAYRPAVGQSLGFMDVRVDLDFASKSFQARVVNPEKPAVCGARIIDGVFDEVPQLILACTFSRNVLAG